MPRRKKNGHSPARLPGGPSRDSPLSQGYDGATARNFPPSTSVPGAVKEKTVKSMQEMFSHLDPEVIYIVLSECDFKVEVAMDSLLELSNAAEVAAPLPPPVSGFERTAAALLSPQHFSQPRPDSDPSKSPQQRSSPPSFNLLTEELDLLVEQELETLTAQQDVEECPSSSSSECPPSAASLPSFPPPPFSQQALPELLQSSLEPGSREPSAKDLGNLVEHVPGASSPLGQLSTWDDQAAEGQPPALDFTHLMTETSAEKPKPSLDLAASGRPSAFQAYKKQEPSHDPSQRAGFGHSDAVVGGARSKVNMLIREPPGYAPGYAPPHWNPEGFLFSPHIHGNQAPAFITPVAQTPFSWPSHPRQASPWLSQGPVSQAPLKPSATIPKSWALPAAPQVSAQHSRLRLEGKLLVLLRGAPGSGKSTLARALLEHNPGGVILSTDEYFTHSGEFRFDPNALGEAHAWNHKRAKEAFEKGMNPIIIDNTNMQGWEMRPYVAQALRHGYKVLFREPDTWWKNKPRELERRSTHNVPVESIRRMLSGYERFVTVQSIMGSQMPEWKQHIVLENKISQPVSSASPCPDLVGPPGLMEGSNKSRSQLFSSLPDVSSIGCSGEVGLPEDGAHKSTESLNFQLRGRPTDNPDVSEVGDNLDLGELDSELDAQLEMNHPIRDQRIPDCIVESVMNEDRCREEMPVAFSESIGQRVRRERPSRREESTEPADLVKDANQSEAKEKEKAKEKGAEEGEEKLLHFVGDWPSEGSLQQRQARKSKRHNETHRREDEGASPSDLLASDNEETTEAQSGPRVTEFQKLLDLIQTGVAPVQTSSSRSISPNSAEELEREGEGCDMIEESRDRTPSSEEEGQNIARVNSSRSELPDCVLDRKITDICIVRESETDHCTTERSSAVSEIGPEAMSEDLKPLSDDSLVIVEATQCPDAVGRDSIEGEAGTDVDTSSCTESGRETESSGFSGSSQERKQRQGRRSGKQCKLALTFSQVCPASSWNTLDCPDTDAQEIDSSQDGIDLKPERNTSLDLKPSFDIATESKSEAVLEPPASPSLVDAGCSTQTEPQDYALLWRVNRPDNSDDTVVTAATLSGDITILSGDSSRFVPELSSAVSAAVAVHPSGHKEVPYRVVHEKSTQVEEKELGVTQDRLESLRILSRHFKLVSFDTLEDLYDKCHQDLEWTTNLLLDSGERFFRDEEGEEEEGLAYEDNNNASSVGGALCEAVETSSCPDVLDEHQHEDLPAGEPTGIEKESLQSTSETVGETEESGSDTPSNVESTDQPDVTSDSEKAPQPEPKAKKDGESSDNAECNVASEPGLKYEAWCGTVDNGVIIEELRVELEDDAASMDEVNRLLQAELEEMDKEEKQRKKERRGAHLDIQSVELKLPTELALQLTELFGPVGIDPGTCSDDDFSVQMDLNLAKLLHQKWKESIQERQRQAALSFHLLQESSVHWGDSQAAKPWPQDRTQPADFLISADGCTSLVSQQESRGQMPFMDHWNVSRPHVSLRDIIKEEQALQHTVEKTRQSRADLDRRDGAALLKEKELYSLFPTIDRHFLQDIFRDHNYQLRETEMFLRSLLHEEPVKTVVAPEAPRATNFRAASKEREKRQKPLESAVLNYQDTEDPEYEDFRAEASLQRRRQLESFAKAAEAYKQGRKEVASFYAQQGHLHGQRMRDANHRAAIQIFQRVNSSLLPKNILDLHGLHVDEALEQLGQVLEDKTADCEHGLCQPQLSVITGRGNHSQGGVARIRPAVIDYLTNKHYRFTEPKPGLVLVSLR